MANRMILNETSYHGAGAIQHIVDEVISRSFKKALVVTDKDLIKFNVVEKVTALLDKAGLAYEIFDEVKANPSVDVIKKGVAKFKQSDADYLIAIGGGVGLLITYLNAMYGSLVIRRKIGCFNF